MKSVVGFLAGISLSSITMAETLTLQAAQEKLLAANPDLRIQREEQDKAEAQLSEARAAYWPSLDASASYQAFSKATEINIDMPAPIGGIHKTLGDKDREEYGIDLTYPLFLGGGRGQQIKARRSSVEAQGERVRAAENQTSLRLAALYYAWNQAEAARQSQESVAGFHREYADRIAKLVKGGAALPSREAAAKAKLLGAELDLRTAMDLRDSIGRASALLLGIPPESPFAFAVDNGTSNPSQGTAEKRHELSYLEKTSTSLEHQEKAIFSQKFPTVVALAGYRLANPGLSQGANSYMDYGLVGVQVKWNLFDGFKNQAQRAQTRIQRDEIRTELQRQTSSFEEAEVSAQKTLDRLKQSQEVAQAAWDAAKLALSETQAQHTHGTATDLELLDAQVLEAKSALLVRQLALQQRLATWQWRYVRGETLKFAGE